MTTQRIAERADRLREALIRTRRDFYLHPELAGKEERTAGVVAGRLRALGLEVQTGVGGHGVIGTLRGKQDEPVVAWRADMDALPIQDTLAAPCRSPVPGVKHACGHDAHTTIGLGAAEVLASMREDIPGTIRFIFQPAEETAKGAKAVILAGGLENPRPAAIFGLHVSPAPAGQVLLAPGHCLAAITDFSVKLRAKPGNRKIDLNTLASDSLAALEGQNAIRYPASVEELDALMRLMRAGDPTLDGFVYFGNLRLEIVSSSDRVIMRGSIFAATDALQVTALERIRQIYDEMTRSDAVSYELMHETFTPALINDLDLLRESQGAISAVIDKDNVAVNNAPWPFGGEDFAYYLQRLPGVFFFLGAANRDKGIVALPHTPDFDVDEQALIIGAKVAASVLLSFLDRRAQV